MRRILSFFLFLPLFALPLCAQDDALVGTWETSFTDPELGDGTIRLSFGADGRFQLDQVISAPDDYLAEAGDADFPIDADVPIVEEVTLQATGTYRVDGDSLFAELTEVSLYADGRDFFEVMTEVIRAFARFAADLAEVSDEDYPAFEQAAIEEFFAGFNLEEEFLGEFTGHLGTYSIDGDTLSITTFEDGEADTIELRRIDPSTAVARSTWGSLKADMRP